MEILVLKNSNNIQKYNENRQIILKCISEGITTCLYGITFNLTCSPQYTKWFEQLQHNWSPIIPKLDMDLVSSPRTSQSSQFSNSMRNPTTDVAQSSQLAHPSYFSNPALMDGSNLQSLHVNTNSLPTPTKGLRGRREPSPSPPLSPASSTPHQRPHTHTYGFILSIYPYHCPTLFLCNIEFSINLKKKNIQITANNIVVFQMLPLIVKW